MRREAPVRLEAEPEAVLAAALEAVSAVAAISAVVAAMAAVAAAMAADTVNQAHRTIKNRGTTRKCRLSLCFIIAPESNSRLNSHGKRDFLLISLNDYLEIGTAPGQRLLNLLDAFDR